MNQIINYQEFQKRKQPKFERGKLPANSSLAKYARGQVEGLTKWRYIDFQPGDTEIKLIGRNGLHQNQSKIFTSWTEALRWVLEEDKE